MFVPVSLVRMGEKRGDLLEFLGKHVLTTTVERRRRQPDGSVSISKEPMYWYFTPGTPPPARVMRMGCRSATVTPLTRTPPRPQI